MRIEGPGGMSFNNHFYQQQRQKNQQDRKKKEEMKNQEGNSFEALLKKVMKEK